MPMLLSYMWMCLGLSGKQADIITTSLTTHLRNYDVSSVSLSNVVIMSAMTRAAIKRCLEFDISLVFELVESKVRPIHLT